MRRILWFFSDRAGCGTYRVMFPANYLAEQGLADHEFVKQQEFVAKGISSFPAGTFDDFDVFVFQRAIGGPWLNLMKECRRRGVATVVELDDDLFVVPKTNPAAEFWDRKDIQRCLEDQLNFADRVIVSTKPLAAVVQDRLGWPTREKISICPNHLHPAAWGEETLSDVEPYKNEGVVIGWQGSKTHTTDFTAAAGALLKIVQNYPHVHLRFFGDCPAPVRAVIPEGRWKVAKAVEFVMYPGTLKFMAFDIGIAPLTPCRFNESKSSLKFLEYAALRIPCVASAVYPYARSIDHGRTGFLASNAREWYDALARLVESATLRKQIGDAAFDEVWAKHSAEVAGPAWHAAFEKLPRRVPRDPTVSAI